jgi:hypothetical protein
MAFSLAGFIGGAATQGLKDIETEELRVKKFYEKELDRSVAEQREMRKERRKKVESRMEQITMLESFFGDDPQARNMAAKVVAGGTANVNMILNTLQKARNNGATKADMFKAIQYVPDKDAPNQSFETAKDAAEAITELVKPADLSGLSSAASKQSKGLFSMAVDKDKIFNTMVQEYKDVGEFKNEDSGKIVQALKGNLKVDFSQLPTEVKSLDTQYDQTAFKLRNLDKNSPTFEADKTNLTSKLNTITKEINAKAKAKDTTDNSPSISIMSSLYTKNISSAEDSVGYNSNNGTAVSPVTGELVSGDEAVAVRNEAVSNAKKEYLKTLLTPEGIPINNNATFIIEGLLIDEFKEYQKNKKGAKSGDTTKPEDINAKIKEKFPTAEEFVKNSLGKANARDNPDRIVQGIMKIYGIDFNEASDLMDSAIKSLPKKQVYVDPTKPVPKRPTGGYIFDSDEEEKAMEEWDKKYARTHNEDGSPKK